MKGRLHDTHDDFLVDPFLLHRSNAMQNVLRDTRRLRNASALVELAKPLQNESEFSLLHSRRDEFGGLG